jgi:3-oxoacyl-[acyl-carrier-protein] synthase-1/3-oxoacyl-[acyl-carrier-protein] synthase II
MSGPASTAPRLVVTGAGAICALGAGLPQIMANLANTTPYRLPQIPQRFETTLRQKPPVFLVENSLDDAEGSGGLFRTSRLALRATREAIAAAWPNGAPCPAARLGVCLGTTVGCSFNNEPFYRARRRGDDGGGDGVQRYLANDLAGVVADAIGAAGPIVTVANACASGADAIGLAASWLAAGACDAVVAGGADELARYAYVGFAALQNVAFEQCRPFDLRRRGLNLGEGAGVVVLEREDDARRRGAPSLGALLGYANAADAHHATAPHPGGRGLRAAIAAALRLAGVAAGAVGLVNAHGTGTIENDRVEGAVLAELFPAAAIVSTKGFTGHTLAAAGALEAIITIHNLRDGWAPRTAGFETPDPACGVVPTAARTPLFTNVAVSTSLAFGGTNAVLVFGKGDAA